MPVLVATSVDQALEAMAEPDAEALAGGTDWMVTVNAGRRVPATVVALRSVDELRAWSTDGRRVRIGAGVTYAQLMADDLAALVPGLARAARTVGSPQIRNAGTIGGNVATASPAGDTLPVLTALEADIEVAGRGGRRSVPFAQFVTGPKRTSLRPGELVTAITVPVADGPQEYLKVGVRNAMVIAVASVAVVVQDGRIAIGMGSVGPTPLRASDAENLAAAGGAAGDIAAAAAREARPIDDHRSTAAYRRHAVEVLTRRALTRVGR